MKKTKDFPNEEWREYKEDDFRDKDVFLISSYGRVIKKKDYDMVVNKEKGYQVKLKNAIVNGYPVFSAKEKSGNIRIRYVHKVMGSIYLKKKKNDKYVIHIDYNKTNNKAENLKWVDKDGLWAHHKTNPNYQESFSTRSLKNLKRSKLTARKILDIRKLADDPNRTLTYREIADKFKITQMQVWRIKNRKNWKHIPEEK